MNTPALFVLPALLAMLGCVGMGCGSSTNTAENPSGAPLSKKIAALTPQITVSEEGDAYAFTFAAGAGGHAGSESLATLRQISAFSVVLYDAGGDRVDSIGTNDISITGTANSETKESSLIGTASLQWTPAGSSRGATYAVATIHSDSGVYTQRLDLPAAKKAVQQTGKSIVMVLDAESRAGGVEFILRVRRVAPPPEGEYVPTGEHYRIVLQDDVGEQVWSSSNGKVFTQALGAVQPTEVGTEIEHRVLWNGRDERTHGRASPGTYRITATLPAKPTSYVLREEFTWSGR